VCKEQNVDPVFPILTLFSIQFIASDETFLVGKTNFGRMLAEEVEVKLSHLVVANMEMQVRMVMSIDFTLVSNIPEFDLLD
jgi:hypothetical protein